MKRYLGYLIVAVVLVFTLTACGRDLSTPSSRLIGHWKADTPLEIEYYFSKTDTKSGVGTITEYDPRDGSVFSGEYKVFSETPGGHEITLITKWPGDNDYGQFMDFVIQKDGMSATMYEFTINYIDSKTEY